MARLEDVYRGLRAEDLPDALQESLRPLLATIDSALTAIFNAVAGGNLTLTDNVAVEKIECQLSHGVAQTVLLKKLRRVGSIVGYSCGEDANGRAHAFAFPPEAKPGTGFRSASITAYFKNNSATRVACTIWIEPDGRSSSKASSIVPWLPSLPAYANNAAAIAGGLTVGSLYRTGADPDPVNIVR